MSVPNIDGITLLTGQFFSPAGSEKPTYSDGELLKVRDGTAPKMNELPHVDAILDGRNVVTANDGAKNITPRPSGLGFGDWEEKDVRICEEPHSITATPHKHWHDHEYVGFIVHTKHFDVTPEGRPDAIYISSDTIDVEELAKMADKHHVAISLMNFGKATFYDGTSEGLADQSGNARQITMDGRQAARLFRDIEGNVLVSMHYELWDHFAQKGE